MSQTVREPRAIPTQTAMAYCREICARKEGRPSLRCRLCLALARGSAKRMRFARRPGNRGCPAINALYAERVERWQPRGRSAL